MRPIGDETRPGTAGFGPAAREKDDADGEVGPARACDEECDSAIDVGCSNVDGGTHMAGKSRDATRSIRPVPVLLMHLCLCCACVLVCMYGDGREQRRSSVMLMCVIFVWHEGEEQRSQEMCCCSWLLGVGRGEKRKETWPLPPMKRSAGKV